MKVVILSVIAERVHVLQRQNQEEKRQGKELRVVLFIINREGESL
jgi:hypothetical protein